MTARQQGQSAFSKPTGAAGAALQSMGRRGCTPRPSRSPSTPPALQAQRLTGAAWSSCPRRPGVVLLGEGPEQRVRRLKAEEKKVNRVAPGVPVHLWVIGNGDDEVKVSKISSKLTRMRPVLTKAETSVVNKRLKSLGGLRTGVPAGMDPTRPRVDRKAMRGK